MMRDAAETNDDESAKNLKAMSGHLAELAALVDYIEHALADERSTDHELDDFVIKHMQKLDFLRQSLEDMSTASRVLSEVLCACANDPTAARSLADQLRLQQSRKVFGLHIDTHDTNHASGDLDLF